MPANQGIRFQENMGDFAELLSKLVKEEKEFAVVMVIRSQGSTAAKVGAKGIVFPDGRILGWLGGWCAENAIMTAVMDAIESGSPKIVRLVMQGEDLRKIGEDYIEVGTPCGGEVDIYIEPVYPKPQIVIVGDNDVSRALSKIAKIVGFKVVVVDSLAVKQNYPDADLILRSLKDIASVRMDRHTFAVLTTMGRVGIEEEILDTLLKTDVGLIGVVSSVRKAKEILGNLIKKKGYTPDQLSRIRAPIGVDIGSLSPEEIALSIVSELVAIRRGGSGRFLVEVKGDPLKSLMEEIEVPRKNK